MAAETELERMVVRLIGDGASYQRMLQNAQDQTMRASQAFQQLGSQMTKYLTIPLVGIGGASVKAFSDFDKAMVESTAIMDVTAAEVKQMRDAALELGSKSIHGPAELARAYFFLASAGMTAQQAIEALPAIQKFASAGNFDLATATNLVVGAQGALGLKVKDTAQNLRNLVDITDALSRANSLSNTNAQQIAEALANRGGAAIKSYGKDMQEGIAVMAAYADQNIKGAEAGSMLSRFMRILAKTSLDNAKEQKALGFSVFDSTGKMRNMADIIGNLEKILLPLSPQMRTAALDTLGFEVRMQDCIFPLLGMSGAIRDYEKILRGAGGETDKIANKQMASFANQAKVLWNQILVVGIAIGEILAPALTFVNTQIQKAIAWWQSLDKTSQTAVVVIGIIVGVLGPLVTALGLIGPAIATGFAILGSIGPIILAGIMAVVGAFAVLSGKATTLEGTWESIKSGAVEAWEIIKSKVQDFVTWVYPVWQAVGGFLAAVWTDVVVPSAQWAWSTIQSIVEEAGRIFLYLWATIGGDSTATWKSVRDDIVEAFLLGEFMIRNFSQTMTLLWTGLQYQVVKWSNYFIYVFTVMLPAVSDWWWKNFSTLATGSFTMAWDAGRFFFTNFVAMMKNLPGIIAGTTSFDEIFTPLTNSWNKVMGELVIPPQVEGELEKRLRKEYEQMDKNLGELYQEFRARRLKEMAGPGDSLLGIDLKGEDKAIKNFHQAWNEGVTEPIVKAKHEIERFDAALVGSAEMFSRLEAYQMKLNDTGAAGGVIGAINANRRNAPLPAFDAAQSGGAEAKARTDSEQTKLLKEMAEYLDKLVKKPGETLAPAALGR